MIVFIATHPALADEKDGMVQRIASIDSLADDLPRVYLDISFRRFWSKRTYQFGKATVLQLNAFAHLFVIASWFRRASTLYVHSLYNSIKVLPFYWIAHPITDMHGVVPEELAHQGKPILAYLFGLVEHVVLRRPAPAIYVTAAMRHHFQRKYQRKLSGVDRTIAILPHLSDLRGLRENVLGAKRDPTTVVYAGGVQAWQNVPLMLEAAAAARSLRYVFLSGEGSALQGQADAAGVLTFSCAAVPHCDVADYYLTCTYGFILRDPVLVNQVACPTKLVEYLYWGVIPIVLTPDIGDFKELGFAFVSLDDFRAGRLPGSAELERMRAVNRQVVDKLINSCEAELLSLQQVLRHA